MGGEKVGGPTFRIDRGKGDVGRHHACHAGSDSRDERALVLGGECCPVGVDRGDRHVRVGCSSAVARIVFGAGQRTRVLASLDPTTNAARNRDRIRAEGAGLDDGIGRKRVQIRYRRKDPVDPDRTRGRSSDGAGPPNHVGLIQPAQCSRRRHFRKTSDLLTRPPLEIGADEERSPARRISSAVSARTESTRPPNRMNPPTPSASAVSMAKDSCAKPPSARARSAGSMSRAAWVTPARPSRALGDRQRQSRPPGYRAGRAA